LDNSHRHYLITSCNSEDVITFAIITITASVAHEMRRAFYALETARGCVSGPRLCLTSFTLSIHSHDIVPDVKDYEKMEMDQLERLHNSIGEEPPDNWIWDIDGEFAKFLERCPSHTTEDCTAIATTLGVYFELDVDCGPVPSHDCLRNIQKMYTQPIPWSLIREWADQV